MLSRSERSRARIRGTLLLPVIVTILLIQGCSSPTDNGSNPSTPATLTSISITPADTSIAPSTTIRLTATGAYSNNTHRVITTSVTWDSSDTTIAAISNTQGSQGVATGTAKIGPTNVTASLGGLSGLTTLSTSTVAAIAVTPASVSIAPQTTQQFNATGTLESGIEQDLTTWASWVSTITTIADIDTTGLATAGTGSGSTTITASYSGVTGTATLLASPVAGISVTPSTATIAKGTTKQFAATGTLTDGAAQILTPWATWSSSSTPVVTISNAAGARGLATAVSEGTSSITASFDSIVSPAAALTVTSPVITSITVAPTSTSIALGKTQQFTAMGAFSDASTQDLSSSAAWHSSNTAVATVSASGLAASVGTGTTSITATASGIASNTATLTVTSAALESILVTPLSTSMVQNSLFQFTATGIYTDGVPRNITTSVTWTSSNPSVATISNTAGFQGIAIASQENTGTTLITATLSGKTSNSATLTVTFF